MDFKKFLDERKSVRQFEVGREISVEEINSMLEHASMAPSSNNAQPWKVFVVRNQEMKEKIKEVSFGQQQVADASVLFIIFGDKSAYDVDKLVKYNIDNGILAPEKAETHRELVTAFFAAHPEDRQNEGVKLDVALFAMNLMHVVRAFGYDSVPVRGTDFAFIQKYLNISEDLVPVLLLPVGVAAAPGYPHIRKSVDEFTEILD